MMNTQPIHILVIDDNETGSLLIKTMFEERKKYIVSEARNHKEAMVVLSNEKCDIILLDIMLPGTDGYEILKEIKSDEKMKDIPVVVISALQENNEVRKALKLGAIDYVKKPVCENNLFERVDALFN